jgi:ABC-2 type transport system ATP-binding protein
MSIVVDALTKRYGPKVAVSDLSFTVRPGVVTGFLGPNGSGKSTTMRCMLGLDRPNAGGATFQGRPYRSFERPLHEVGALLDAGFVHPGRSGRNHLRWLAASNRIDAERVDAALERVGLTSAARKPVKTYSLGMKQRLGLANALLRPRELLVLDEPTNGLDPQGTREVRSLIRSFAADGTTVFVSSHLLAEIEQLCSHVAVMSAGSLVAQGTLDALRGPDATTVSVRTPDADAAQAVLSGLGLSPEATPLDHGDHHVTAAVDRSRIDPDAIVAALVAGGVRVRGFSLDEPSLEDRFVALTGEGFDVVA